MTQGRPPKALRCSEFGFTLYWHQRELCFHGRSNTGKHSRVSINTFINPGARPVRVSTLFSGGAATDYRVLLEWGSIHLKVQWWQRTMSLATENVNYIYIYIYISIITPTLLERHSIGVQFHCSKNQNTSCHNSVAVFVSITSTTFTFMSQCVMFAELYRHKMEQKLLVYVFSTEPWRDMGWFFFNGQEVEKKTFATRFNQAWNVLLFVSRLAGHLLVLSK